MKSLLLITGLSLITLFAKAQDVLYFKSGNEVKAKVLTAGSDMITYKNYNYPNGSTVTVLTNDVKKIKYQDGKEVMLDRPVAGNTPASPIPMAEKKISQETISTDNKSNKEDNKEYFGLSLLLGTSGIQSKNMNVGNLLDAAIVFSGGYNINKYFTGTAGLGYEFASWMYNRSNPQTDGIQYVNIPVRAQFKSGTLARIGFYAEAGFNIRFLYKVKTMSIDDNSGPQITYDNYKRTMFCPAVSAGFFIRNRAKNDPRYKVMFGAYYEFSTSYIFRDNIDVNGKFNAFGLRLTFAYN